MRQKGQQVRALAGGSAAATFTASAALLSRQFQELAYAALRWVANRSSGTAAAAAAVAWAVWRALIGRQLQEAEVEWLQERAWRDLMEAAVAMTWFRAHLSLALLARFALLLFIKALHCIAMKRAELLQSTPPAPSSSSSSSSFSQFVRSHLRISTFLSLLLLLDSAVLGLSIRVSSSTASASSSNSSNQHHRFLSLIFAFEYLILATSAMASLLQYCFHALGSVIEGRCDDTAAVSFYLELLRDLVRVALYLLFFVVVFLNYGLPLHLIREVYDNSRSFKCRVSELLHYQKTTSDMNERFPDATKKELRSRGDATCIICREAMVTAKKLQCGHMFHLRCLQSWLERQQACPMCRAPVTYNSVNYCFTY